MRAVPEVDYAGMRKRLITPTPQGIRPTDEGWLDLDRAPSVEVTSEEKDYGIDSAMVSGKTQGWRAASPGTQTIRLVFDQPQRLRRIALVFEETETERTQEFVLRWSPDGGRSFREIVRQQWNFSPNRGHRTTMASAIWIDSEERFATRPTHLPALGLHENASI